MMSGSSRWQLLGAMGLGALMLFGWPTLYRYDTMEMADGGGTTRLVFRTNRVTGSVERLTVQGWRTCENEHRLEGKLVDLTDTECNSLKCEASLNEDGWVDGSVYNGNPFAVESITYFVIFAKFLPEGATIPEKAAKVRLPNGKEINRFTALTDVRHAAVEVTDVRSYEEACDIAGRQTSRVMFDVGHERGAEEPVLVVIGGAKRRDR